MHSKSLICRSTTYIQQGHTHHNMTASYVCLPFQSLPHTQHACHVISLLQVQPLWLHEGCTTKVHCSSAHAAWLTLKAQSTYKAEHPHWPTFSKPSQCPSPLLSIPHRRGRRRRHLEHCADLDCFACCLVYAAGMSACNCKDQITPMAGELWHAAFGRGYVSFTSVLDHCETSDAPDLRRCIESGAAQCCVTGAFVNHFERLELVRVNECQSLSH